jgi:hypothetical protein
VLNGEVFIKRSRADASKRYPDFNSSYETFTNQDFLELETLGPLHQTKQGQTVEHTESWSLHRGVKIASWTDAELDRALLPLLK